MWAFVNDALILSVSDSSLDAGTANVVINRAGPPSADDKAEVSAVMRNLRISAIAGGDQARQPVFQAVPQVVTASAFPCTLPTALPSDIQLMPPPADLDPKLALLYGAFEGNWGEGTDNPLPSRVYVQQIDGAKASVVYTWGNNRGTTAGFSRNDADVDADGKITFGQPNRRFSFWSTGDNTLAGSLDTPSFTSKITLNRCPSV